MKVAIIGLGLIGGSLAVALKENDIAQSIWGIDTNSDHTQYALNQGMVNAVGSLEEVLPHADVVFIAIPVNTASALISRILDLTSNAVVIDLGSTKKSICDAASQHKERNRYVAAHPMWGTEFSGPASAVSGAFRGNAVVFCDTERSDPRAVAVASDIFEKLGMRAVFMEAEAHDTHAAYVSHISHITSFALANTVLEKEREEEAIFEMASGGFESTVRLAKSNPSMWVPVFMDNRENVLDVLNEHIAQLKKFKSCLEKENDTWLWELIDKANQIKKVLKSKSHSPIN